jgi:hypothetical protein
VVLQPIEEFGVAERYPIYAETDIIVDTDDSPHETMVDRIIDALEAYQRDGAGDPAS